MKPEDIFELIKKNDEFGIENFYSTLIINRFGKFDGMFMEYLNILNDNNETAAMYAINNKKENILPILVKYGVSIFIKDNNDLWPLAWACKNGNHKMVCYMLGERSLKNYQHIKNKTGKCALLISAENGNAECVIEIAKQHGSNVNEIDQNGDNAFILMAKNKHFEPLVKIIKLPINPNIKNNQNKKITDYLHKEEQNELCKILEEKIKILDIKKKNESDKASLLNAVNENNIEKVEKLLQNKIDPNFSIKMKNGIYAFPLGAAVDNESVPMINILLKYKADINFHSHDAHTAFFKSVQNNSPNMVRVLLENKSIMSNPEYQIQPIDIIMENDNVEILSIMLEHKFDVQCCKHEIDVVDLLRWAVRDNKLNCAKKLVSHNLINIHKLNEYNENILHDAAVLKDEKMAEFLVSIGVSGDVKNINGQTPLDIAKEYKNNKTEKVLIDQNQNNMQQEI